MNRARRRRVAVLLSAFALLVAAVVGVTVVLLARSPLPAVSACTVTSGTSGTGDGPYVLSPVQAQNAAIIAAVGIHRGLQDHAVTIALAAALQESKLLDLPYGDRDSLGLFQQRPSQGWGTPAEILDPAFAAAAFYDHLALIPDWTALPVTQAAQSVQGSADPAAYAQWEPEARALASATTGEHPAALTCQLGAFGGPRPLPNALPDAAASQLGPGALTDPPGTKAGWQAATWAVAHAYNYHLTSVTYDGLRWSWGSSATAWSPAPPTRSVVTTTD